MLRPIKKLPRISVLNVLGTILSIINVSFIVHFGLSEYSFTLHTFLIQLEYIEHLANYFTEEINCNLFYKKKNTVNYFTMKKNFTTPC